MNSTPHLIPLESNPQFHQFWEAYPLKHKKADAEKAFQTAIRKTTIQVLLASIEEHKQTKGWQKDNGDYVPLPASFLRAQQWLDTLTLTKPASVKELSPVEKQIHHQEYLRILEEIKTIRHSYDDHQNKSQSDLNRLKLLVNRRNQLRVMLGILR